MNVTLRCRHCDDVIGLYEPMIVLRAGHPRKTSRTAELAAGVPLTESAGAFYHDACYQQSHSDDPVPE